MYKQWTERDELQIYTSENITLNYLYNKPFYGLLIIIKNGNPRQENVNGKCCHFYDRKLKLVNRKLSF